MQCCMCCVYCLTELHSAGLYIGLLSSAVLCVVVVLILTVLVILFSAKRRGSKLFLT